MTLAAPDVNLKRLAVRKIVCTVVSVHGNDSTCRSENWDRIKVTVHLNPAAALVYSAVENIRPSALGKVDVNVCEVKLLIHLSCDRTNHKCATEDKLIFRLVGVLIVVAVVHGHADGLALGVGAIVCAVHIGNHLMAQTKEVLRNLLHRIALLPGLLTHKLGI